MIDQKLYPKAQLPSKDADKQFQVSNTQEKLLRFQGKQKKNQRHASSIWFLIFFLERDERRSIHTHIYIYIYIEREREREREMVSQPPSFYASSKVKPHK